jgi:hypothetical protein
MEEDALPHWSPATNIPSSPPLDPRYRAPSPTSSEPPLFSSDGPLDAEDITNYESPRIKRKRAGPWYEQGFGRTLRRKKSRLSRNFDSGVCIMSDGSFGSDSSTEMSTGAGLPAREETGAERIARETDGMRPAELLMYRHVHDVVEAGKTVFDLSALGLQDSDLLNLRPINTIIQAPLDAGVDVPVEGQYRSMIPEIHLNLMQNNLARLAPTLFDLQHLSSLNLRSNQMQELPPQIAKLTQLAMLDLSHNQLKWLPCEILSLFRPPTSGCMGVYTVRLNLFGNPMCAAKTEDSRLAEAGLGWIASRRMPLSLLQDPKCMLLWINARPTKGRPNADTFHLVKRLELRVREMDQDDQSVKHTPYVGHHRYCFSPYFLGASPPSYFDRQGNLLPGSADASTSEVVIDTNGRGTWGVSARPNISPPRTKVKSLVSIAMKTLLQFATPAEIRQTAAEDLGQELPQPVEALLRRAEGNWNHPNHLDQCHVCGDMYIVPAAEWYELWAPEDWKPMTATGLQPTLKVRVRVCSWACIPDIVSRREEELLDTHAQAEEMEE